ncbi:MAG: STAS domain-containing protein [Deltaproteobacteria bacterium]|nr:STAS domain-containing protein [Deltaproteobacteria bacterium]MBW2595793.1 STAS domain-containing protein [Deltaproteobacteria bacterium]
MAKNNKVPEAQVAISRKKIGGEIPIVVNELTDKCLYTGFFGTLDSARMVSITDRVLDLLSATDIEIIIIDLSNVDIIDSAVATHLIRLGDTLTLVGVKIIFCGIPSTVAQIMVSAGIDVRGFRVSKNLKSAVKEMFAIQGLKIVSMFPEEQIAR